jgi:hypothetical protein
MEHSNALVWTDKSAKDKFWAAECADEEDEERFRLSPEDATPLEFQNVLRKMVTLGVNGEKFPVDPSVASFLQNPENNNKGFAVELFNGINVVYYKLIDKCCVQVRTIPRKTKQPQIVLPTSRLVNTTYEVLNSLGKTASDFQCDYFVALEPDDPIIYCAECRYIAGAGAGKKTEGKKYSVHLVVFDT